MTLYKGWLVLKLRERDTLQGMVGARAKRRDTLQRMVGARAKRKGHFTKDGRC